MAAEEAIVLVGGFGTRLRAVVSDVPKPLAPVAGRPFLAHLLDGYAAAGLRRVILATGYGSEQIVAAVGARWRGMEIAYSHEDRPLGTGGAIRQALAGVQGPGGVHIANGDTHLRYDPAALEAATRAHPECLLGLALARVEDVGRYGAVDVRAGRVAGFREKGGTGPGLINAGSYFLAEAGFDQLPADPAWSFEERVLLPWSARGSVAAFDATSDFIDIGVPGDYRRAQAMFAESAP